VKNAWPQSAKLPFEAGLMDAKCPVCVPTASTDNPLCEDCYESWQASLNIE